MLKIQTKTTQRIRICLIVFFLIQIFLTTQPFTWSESDFRAAAAGGKVTVGYSDSVVLDVKTVVDGKKYDIGCVEDWAVRLDKDPYFAGFAKNIVDHSQGDKFTFKAKFPDDFKDESVAGKEADFTVKIKKVSKKLIYTAVDFVQLIGSSDSSGNTISSLTTIGFCYLCFLIIPIIAVAFQIFDFYYNIKNIAGFICSLLGVLAVITFVGKNIFIGAVITIIIYLFTAFMSVMGIMARYQIKEETVIKKKKREYKPDDIV